MREVNSGGRRDEVNWNQQQHHRNLPPEMLILNGIWLITRKKTASAALEVIKSQLNLHIQYLNVYLHELNIFLKI